MTEMRIGDQTVRYDREAGSDIETIEQGEVFEYVMYIPSAVPAGGLPRTTPRPR